MSLVIKIINNGISILEQSNILKFTNHTSDRRSNARTECFLSPITLQAGFTEFSKDSES